MRGPTRRTALGALAGLAACGPDPRLDFTRPEAAPRFAQAGADTPTTWPDPAWWRAYGSAELDALIAQAQVGEAGLRAAAFRIAQSEAGARIARAALAPSVSLGAGIARARGPDLAGGRNNREGEAASLTLSASYEVDLWGRLSSAARAGDARVLASRHDRDALALSITAQTAAAYFTLLAIRRRLALLAESAAAARRILSQVEIQRAEGAASEVELEEQRAALAAQQASLEALRGQEAEALANLALLLGQRPDQVEVRARSLDGLTPPPIIAGLPSELLLRRPDIARVEAELAAAGLDAESARAARFPSLVLTVAGGLQSGDLSAFLTPQGAAFTLAAGLLAPLLQGGRLRAQQDQAVARAQEIAELRAGVILAAFRDVEAALALAEAARRSLEQRRAGFQAAQRAYRLAELRWREGALPFVSVLQAQQSALSANEQLVLAELSRLASTVALYRALGGGWGGTGAG
jgi:NodT family efflux transporter outer membrane factor (OMF) lipoprotein